MIRTPTVTVKLTWREISALKTLIEHAGHNQRGGVPTWTRYSGPYKRKLVSAHQKLDQVDHELLETTRDSMLPARRRLP